MKPGFKTSEFWLTLVQSLTGPTLAVLVATGVILPDVTDEVANSVTQITGGVIALVAMFASGRAVRSYSDARAAVKIAQVSSAEEKVGF